MEETQATTCIKKIYEPYKDRMGKVVKDIVQKYWLEHARVSTHSNSLSFNGFFPLPLKGVGDPSCNMYKNSL